MQAQILNILKKSQEPVSGQEISAATGSSRTAVWKSMNDLRRRGYKIAAFSGKGYVLQGSPDKLYSWEIQTGLRTRCFGQRTVYQESVESTMNLASVYADRGAEHGSLFCAETQTRGRGRFGRAWSSPYGQGIYASLLLRPEMPVTQSTKMVFLAAVALRDALFSSTGLDIHIKWPNDLLIGSRKLAGILTELRAQSDRVERLVIGVGINVNIPKKALPSQATSLLAESGTVYSRVCLLQDFLLCCENRYEQVLKEGFGPVLFDWKNHCRLWGERVAVEMGQKVLEGTVTDLADDGGLIIRLQDGRTQKILSGDIVRLRRGHGR